MVGKQPKRKERPGVDEYGRTALHNALVPLSGPVDLAVIVALLQQGAGWLELGNCLEAEKEIHQISQEYQSHPEVLNVHWHFLAHSKEWQSCLKAAVLMTQLAPDGPQGWLNQATALRFLDRPQAAYVLLAPVSCQVPGERQNCL